MIFPVAVVGSAIAPVIKVCANPDTFKRMGGVDQQIHHHLL